MKSSNKSFIIKILVPTILAIIIYSLSLFFFIVPTIENTIMKGKQEMLRELIHSSYNIFKRYHHLEVNGKLSKEKAQKESLEIIRNLRYGPNHRHYFWINDYKRHMIMHPYRPELENTDVTHLKDVTGFSLIVRFVEIAKQSDEGFVKYMWQWYDEQDKVVPKISFVKGFHPWGWVIGTGVYLDDVQKEISIIIKRLIHISLFIILTVVTIAAYTIRQSFKIAEKKEELAELNSTKNMFFSIVAHDLKNPVSTIKGLSDAVVQEVKGDDADINAIRDVATRLDKSILNINKFLNNLLIWAKLQADKNIKVIDRFNIETIIDENITLLSDMAFNKNITLKKITDGNINIVCDRNMIDTVLRNLLSNAIKFTPTNGEVIINAVEQTKHVEISVHDNGVGITPDALLKLFKIEETCTTPGTMNEKGSGLGLILCHDFVEKNDGRIWATSSKQDGTTFHIILPKKE